MVVLVKDPFSWNKYLKNAAFSTLPFPGKFFNLLISIDKI